MGRRKNNPALVRELIDGRWTMDQDEFERKYNTLSSSDMSKVSEAIYNMESELTSSDDDYDEDDPYGESLDDYESELYSFCSGDDD